MSVHHTMGGVRINLDNQVLDRYDQAIWFFAVGEVTGGIHGSNRLAATLFATFSRSVADGHLPRQAPQVKS